MSDQKKVVIYDTTLRDGAQMQNFNPSVDDKIRIAKALDKFGIPYIEGGWPSEKETTDTAYFRKLPTLKQAKHVAFGMTRRRNCVPEKDGSFCKVVNSGADTICLFGKTWDRHVRDALGAELDENLAMIADSVAYVKAQGKEMIFDAEHFFDGYKANPEYALECLRAAHNAGADWLVLCETNGGTLPYEVDEIVCAVRAALPDAKLGIHPHNDNECAVANAIMAIRAGCTMVQGTFNGYGERIGNANLTTLLPVLKYKMGYDIGISDEAMTGLKALSEWVDEVAELETPANRAYVGDNAFAHKGGVHTSAVMKNPAMYEQIDPALVGNKRHIPISDQSGMASLRMALEVIGVNPDDHKEKLQQLLDTVKVKEKNGFTFDKVPGSFAVLAARLLGQDFEPFRLPYHKITMEGIHDKENGDHDDCAATAILMCNGKRIETKGDSKEGSVDALDKAIRKALSVSYPELNSLMLKNYRSDIINKDSKTGARTRVYIDSYDMITGKVIRTMGVSTNIIRASLDALLDSYQHIILMHHAE